MKKEKTFHCSKICELNFVTCLLNGFGKNVHEKTCRQTLENQTVHCDRKVHDTLWNVFVHYKQQTDMLMHVR